MNTKTADDATAKYRCEPDAGDAIREDDGPEELKEMFSALRAQGIVTIEGDVCCTGCLGGFAADHMAGLEDAGEEVRGYVGYHEQDLNERYVRGYDYDEPTEAYVSYDVDSIYLAFGATRDDVGDTAAIAGRIMSAAHEAGLEAEWEGDVYQKVVIHL